MLFQSSVEFAFKCVHSYFAEIGYNRVFKVLNCSLKMAPAATRSALQTVREKPATGPGEIHFPSLNPPIQPVYRGSLFCFSSRKREGERRRFGFCGYKTVRKRGRCFAAPVLVGTDLASLWHRVQRESVCGARRGQSSPVKPQTWGYCGGCAVSC